MWPDDFIDWARRNRPRALRLVATALSSLLVGTRIFAEVPRLGTLGVRQALDVANDRRRFRGYFPDERTFGLWLVVTALRESHRLLLRHRLVELELQRLPADECRLLGMMYLEQLSDADVASLLQIPRLQVGAMRQQAWSALIALLR